MSQISYYTEEGLKKLKDELHEMKTVQRPSISNQIAEARDKGDLSENAEYDAAKEAQGLLEMKISKMEAILANARLIDNSIIDNSKVFILSKVKIKNVANGMQMEYTLVAENEADLKEKKISVDSPIGKGLLGKVKGDIADVVACKFLLKKWLIKKAEKHLGSWLRQVSINIQLPYRTTTVRSQKTLWGSCSCDRNISLNYKLLFLEPNVVEYVLVHELCHTIHMNHSDKFWQLVRKFEPNYKLLDKSLKQAWQIIPAWLDW
jgi:transcription elongation factor GreA